MPKTKYKRGQRLKERKRRELETQQEINERNFQIKQARNNPSFDDIRKRLGL